MTSYVVVPNKEKSLFNILVDKTTKTRIFTPTSLLYRSLSGNFDMVETINEKVMQIKEKETIKAIQQKGREENNNLRKAAFQVFDLLGWDQDKFDDGFNFIAESSYERIPDDLKFQHMDVIEEAFYTMGCRVNFYQFLRNYTDGSIKAKHQVAELLKDMIMGINIQNQLSAFFKSEKAEV